MAGIDIFALKNNKALFLELKSHKEFSNIQFNNAIIQYENNTYNVDEFIRCTSYKKENVRYLLVYYIRNKELYIVDENKNKVIFQKNSKMNINNFLNESFKSIKIFNV